MTKWRGPLKPMFATEPPLEGPQDVPLRASYETERHSFSRTEEEMPDIEVRYARGDRFLIQVRDHHLVVDQPRASGGDDVGPTPTELFVAGLATCVAFYAERFFVRHGVSADGLRVDCDFDLTKDSPNRVDSIDLRVTLPAGFLPERRAALLAVIEHCTVHNSLRVPPEVRISLNERETVAA
jgi:putative redox protein